jgi:hypothetical protein
MQILDSKTKITALWPGKKSLAWNYHAGVSYLHRNNYGQIQMWIQRCKTILTQINIQIKCGINVAE